MRFEVGNFLVQSWDFVSDLSFQIFCAPPCLFLQSLMADCNVRAWSCFLRRQHCVNLIGISYRYTLACKAPAKRSQHTNTTYRNIVGRNMLRAFGHRVAMCCDMLCVVGSNLTCFKLEPTTRNMSQQGGQTRETCCAQQCWDVLR